MDMAKFCKYCGAPLKEGARFCPNCGKEVVSSVPNQVKQAPEPEYEEPATGAPKRKSKAGLIVACIALVIALAGGAIWLLSSDGSSDDDSRSGKKSSKNSQLAKAGYEIELPEDAEDVDIELISKKKMAGMNTENYEFIGQPVNVSQDGDDHVILDRMARVTFPIPKDIPKEEYINLMGVLVMDGKTTYMVPDYDGIQNGVITFETSHFCVTGAAKVDNIFRREEFINRVAASEWHAGMTNKDLEKSLKEKLKEAAELAGFGENDLLGFTARQVLSDNDFYQKAMDIVDMYDSSGGDPEEIAKKVSEKMADEVRSKILSTLFEKLKSDMEKDLVDFDPKTGKFIHTKVTMESDYKDYIEILEEHLTQENMEQLGERLGKGDSPGRIAMDYYVGFCKSWAKDFSVKMVPQIKMIQSAASTMKALKEFWASNDMNEMFKEYSEKCNSDGVMKDEDWNLFTFNYTRLTACKSNFGLTEAQIRQQFVDRFKNDRDINMRKERLRKLIALYEDTGRYSLINARIFDKMHINDYIQRLTRVHMLVERFRAELVDKNGYLPGKSAGKTVDETLCEIVDKYLELYPDQEAFYKWLIEEGYYANKLKKQLDGLDSVRSWWLVKVEVETQPDDDSEIHVHYAASAEKHQSHVSWNGEEFQDMNDPEGKRWYRPFNCSFTATISPTPPSFVEAGDSLVFHLTVQQSGSANAWTVLDGAYLYRYYYGTGKAKVKNMKGSDTVGTGNPSSGEWDAVLYFGQGHKGDMYTVDFAGCGSSTHWYYKWCSVFERNE